MKLSTKNRFPNHTLFLEITTFFEITANQTLFVVRSVLKFCLQWAPLKNTELEKKIQARYWEFTHLNFSATNQSNSVWLFIFI